MLRIGESNDVQDVDAVLRNEVGILSVLAPTGEDMIVVCPPGGTWSVQKSIYRPAADGADRLWHITKVASWVTSVKPSA
ncbi:MAG: hypothetical protein DMG31_05755 [Acidobacteria bacterium]|jgi:hypothetical protein|nr:MAG: hypothetical protein DMG31_05755 [Acidobacteriota bacterium]